MAENAEALSDFDLWSLLDLTGFAIYRLRQVELAKLGLTIEQSGILDLLKNRGGSTTAREIEDITLRQHHTISIMLNRMVRLGLVRREKIGSGKGYKILIAPDGQTVLEKMPLGSIESAFSILSPEHKRQLANCLYSLWQRVRRLLGSPHGSPFKTQLCGDSALELMELLLDGNKPISDYRLWSLLNRARFAIGRLREMELAQFGLTIEQSSILRIVKESGGSATGKALEKATMRQHHSISTLVNRMVGIGFVKKERPDAGRADRIILTQEGEGVLQRLTTTALEMAFSELTPLEKQKLAALLCLLNARARELHSASDQAFCATSSVA